MAASNRTKKTETDWVSLIAEARSQAQVERIAEALKAGDIDAALTALHTRGPLSTASPRIRKPGRFKGKLVIGPEFFEPLNENEIKELTGE